ncbi:hypothetical protein PR202_gb07920 [Eleusine coracana subsp. coracana]|uniref:Uncharacterized protein n=1 Tax=Eleusine coracana subsp. coracana TaxID=191504 RepID=A0AAV5EBN7_ELECO|nr:hypothetical protein PR202_gb07920 [Eleusine coracana subsp. coracana]
MVPPTRSSSSQSLVVTSNRRSLAPRLRLPLPASARLVSPSGGVQTPSSELHDGEGEQGRAAMRPSTKLHKLRLQPVNVYTVAGKAASTPTSGRPLPRADLPHLAATLLFVALQVTRMVPPHADAARG